MFYPLNYGDQRRGTLPAGRGSSKPEICSEPRNHAMKPYLSKELNPSCT